MTTADASARLLAARIALQIAVKRADASKLLPRPRDRAETVARLKVADELRRAVAEHAAAMQATEGATPA